MRRVKIADAIRGHTAISDTNRLRIADGGFNIADRRIGEVRVIPNVEEISREAEALPLRDLEILDEGEIPVLLVGSTIDVPAKIAERRHRPIAAVRWANERGRHEIGGIQVAVVHLIVNAAARESAADRSAVHKLRTEGC